MGNEMGFSNLPTLLDSQEVKHRALLTDTPDAPLLPQRSYSVYTTHRLIQTRKFKEVR